ncbi:MAG: dihydropteroate synthase [Deltaproteobacteria bacterium]|nr:dihydropteroate synthase [Deltaproteobacteria bacterium]
MKKHIPLGVGFYPDWWNKHYGISYDRQYYFDPETRIAARQEMDHRLYERFGDIGLGDPDPKPKPFITFGMVLLPAVFGCEIVFKKDALPWALPLNLSDEQVWKLAVPDIVAAYPLTEVMKQIEYLRGKYGRVVGDINTTGVQNLALKLRGEQLYFDYFEKPDLCHHLLAVCTEAIIRLFWLIYKITGTGALDVTPMCDPRLFVLPNCTVEQISLATYEKFNLPYDNRVAKVCHPLGIHHCGSVNQVLDGYAQVRHLKFLEIGFGSDVRRTREVLGPKVAVNARINPVLMKNGDPEDVSREVRRLIDQGRPLENFSIDTVGLTYGTPDENVRAARRTAAEYGKIMKEEQRKKKGLVAGVSKKRETLETVIRSPTRTVRIGTQQPVTIIGERINPTGRKKLARALEENDLKMVQEEALAQVRAGAHILDVNVGVSGIDEPWVLEEVVRVIQDVTDVPLCLDSALPQALEAGLKVYRGKALVNSVNGEEEKLNRILPLVKKYGAAVIGLTLDDRGIPRKAEDRLEIAAKIVRRAEQEGLSREDVIIDPLAMALSADHQAAVETLKALRLIRKELGVNLTLGLSNISFGLPERTAINTAFLNMAVLNGLTCAIMDPTDWEMGRAALLGDLLLGKDENCLQYLAATARQAAGELGENREPASAALPASDLEQLKALVIEGKGREAEELTRRVLEQGSDPQEIIQGTLIPALNVVGERFENRKIFVPEMMVSAKAMQACVDLVRPHLGRTTAEAPLATIVLGTVFGDLHDIGKNLVKLFLESAGLRVIDLGENVPAERFVEAAREHQARVIGLSSLLTTGDPFVEQTVKAVKAALGEQVKVICGGAALTPQFVLKICGADAHARDAADGLKKIKQILAVS